MNRVISKPFVWIVLILGLQFMMWYGFEPVKVNKKGLYDQPSSVWQGARYIRPNLHVVPPVPSKTQAMALSFGDRQLFFRIGTFRLQTAGDSFGRVTPLKDYDYEELYKWWKLLDTYDAKSSFAPSIASYYFGATQNPEEQVPYVVRYLEEHSDQDPAANWWWYHQASYLARHRLKDKEWGLALAYKLRDVPKEVEMPFWARQMPAFLLEDKGEYAQACQIVLDVLDSVNQDEIKQGELNFMFYFIEERIASFLDDEASNIDPRCKQIAWISEQRKKRKMIKPGTAVSENEEGSEEQ